jgi:tRNA U34 5-methylaminomethyl-2-thiouridine-forming methyltransferase MnmC
MTDANAPDDALDWREDVPVSRRYGDPYYSLRGGAAEARHVFLAGNDLPARLRPGFHVAELGFGTGLNALVLAQAARAAGVEARMTSFEARPLPRTDLARALAAFAEIDAAPLLDVWPAERIALPGLRLTLVPGDARRAVPAWAGTAEAWFLDGFAPARNPEMWEPALMRAVARSTAPGGTFATYTAAGHVRRALAEAGFAVERVPGFAGKRHMTRGRLR